MTGESPSFLLPACFLEDIEKRFVFFAAFRAHIQVFTDQRHELRCVLFIHFPIYILIDLCIDFITRKVLFPHAFQYAQESQDSCIGKLLLMIETALDLLDNGSDVHNLCL